MIEDKWVTVKEAMKITGLSRTSIQYYIKKGVLEVRKVKELYKNYIRYLSIPTNLREKYERRNKKTS